MNNPYPNGYRLPTEAELNAEKQSWISNDAIGAISSPLRIIAGGYRVSWTGMVEAVGFAGHYWSSSIQVGNTNGSHNISFGLNCTPSWMRGNGFSVRFIKD